jgi:hypothetical protein
VRAKCAQGMWFRKKLWHARTHARTRTHTHTHTESGQKRKCSKSLSLSIYIYIRTHMIWQCGLRLIALEENQIPSPCYSTQLSRTYTQTNIQRLILHPKPNSTLFRSRRGNWNTEFHVFHRNVCPIHFGTCIFVFYFSPWWNSANKNTVKSRITT